MPSLLVVNPNTTAAMTRGIAAAARAVASPGTRIVARNPDTGPASIESPYDQELCLLPLLAEVARGERDGCGDGDRLLRRSGRGDRAIPGLGSRASPRPRCAGGYRWRFGVVTTVAAAVPGIEALVPLRRHALPRWRARRWSEGASTGATGSDRLPAPRDTAAHLVRVDRADARWAARECRPSDRVCSRSRGAGRRRLSSAVKLAESLLALGLSTGKRRLRPASMAARRK